MSTTAPQGNRANAHETKILAEWAKTHRRAVDAAVKAGHLVYSNQMTLRNPDFVTVGDVCITAIGQITGRDYQHLRFWGDGRDSLVIMDYDAITPATLRAIWSDCGTPDTASRQLLDSLLLDYRSRAGKPDRTSDPEAATFSDDWQISASQRLLFYYPKQTAPMIAARLNALLVGSTGPNESSLQAKRQRDANQVDPVEFIEAVAECPDAAIRKPIRSIFLRSDDVHVWLACLAALDPVRDWPMIESRFGSLVRKNAWFSGFTGITDVFIDLRSFGGERARPLFRTFQKKARSVDDRDTLISALMVGDGKWDREFVAPFLTDRRMTTWSSPISSKQRTAEKRMRLCDVAANVICWHRGQTVFPPPGAENDMDLFERHLAETMAAGRN